MTQVTLFTIDNAHATATISLYGAQVLSFIPKHDRRERLFLSKKALLDGSKSIRGGIPVCWPWFGAWKGASHGTAMPAHGYARNRPWRLVSMIEAAAATVVTLKLDDCTGPGFPHPAGVEVVIAIGRKLSVALTTTNSGSTAFPLSAALHSYFAVSNIEILSLSGLKGIYSDKTRDWAMLDTPSIYRFTEETDRIHLHAAAQVDIHDTDCTVAVQSLGHDSIVVWNPWADGSKAFADLDAADYRRFVCVETALTQGFMLAPGTTHSLQQTIS